MKNTKKERDIEKTIIRDCPILYKMASYDRSGYYGFEFDRGWDNIVANMSYKLEALNNIFYPKTRVRIQIDQLKSKYGLPCFYWNIVIDPPAYKCFVNSIIHKITSKLDKVDFKYIKVIDSPTTHYDETTEISREEYITHLSWKASNENLFIKDGKFFRTLHLTKFETYHMKPTKHLILYWLKQKISDFNSFIQLFDYNTKDNPKSIATKALLRDLTKVIVSEADKECQGHCEHCGKTIGEEWSPSCQTSGWITYLCKDCANESKHSYYMNGALYKEGTLLKTAEQIEQEKQEAEVKYNENKQKRKEYIDEEIRNADLTVRNQTQIKLSI